METVTQIGNVLVFFGLGFAAFALLYASVNQFRRWPRNFFRLGLLFMFIIMADNLTAAGWAIVNHDENVFFFNWWSGIQWFSFQEAPNTVPAGNPEGLLALEVLFNGFWKQSPTAIVLVFLWWAVQASALAEAARLAYRWLDRKLA